MTLGQHRAVGVESEVIFMTLSAKWPTGEDWPARQFWPISNSNCVRRLVSIVETTQGLTSW